MLAGAATPAAWRCSRRCAGSRRATAVLSTLCGSSLVASIWLTETVLHRVMRRAAVPRTQFRRGREIIVAWGRRMVQVAWGWCVVHVGRWRRWRRRVISGGWRRRIPKIRRRGLRWKLRSYRGGRSNSQCANSAEREDGFCCGPHGAALSFVSPAVYRPLTDDRIRRRVS